MSLIGKKWPQSVEQMSYVQLVALILHQGPVLFGKHVMWLQMRDVGQLVFSYLLNSTEYILQCDEN